MDTIWVDQVKSKCERSLQRHSALQQQFSQTNVRNVVPSAAIRTHGAHSGTTPLAMIKPAASASAQVSTGIASASAAAFTLSPAARVGCRRAAVAARGAILRADARCSWSWIRVAFLPLRIDSALPLQLKCSWRIGMPTRSSLTIDRAGSSCHFIETKGQNNRFAFAPSAVKSGNWAACGALRKSAAGERSRNSEQSRH